MYTFTCSVTIKRREYGYCEIRGRNDDDHHVAKTTEYLFVNEWVSDATDCVLFIP